MVVRAAHGTALSQMPGGGRPPFASLLRREEDMVRIPSLCPTSPPVISDPAKVGSRTWPCPQCPSAKAPPAGGGRLDRGARLKPEPGPLSPPPSSCAHLPVPLPLSPGHTVRGHSLLPCKLRLVLRSSGRTPLLLGALGAASGLLSARPPLPGPPLLLLSLPRARCLPVVSSPSRTAPPL